MKRMRLIVIAVLLCSAVISWGYYGFVAKEYKTFEARDPQTGLLISSYCQLHPSSMLWFAYLRIEEPRNAKRIMEIQLDANLSADGPDSCQYYAPESVLADRKAGTVIVNTRSKFMPRVTVTLPESARSHE